MDIELPNGYVIQGIPEGTSKQDIMSKAIKAGLATAADFGQASAPQGRPTMANDPRILTGSEPTASNETFMDKASNAIQAAGDFLAKPRPIVTPQQLGGSTAGRITQGLLDPLQGIGQGVSKLLGNDSVSQRITAQEQQYQQARAQSGDTGIDVGRLFGNVANPINYAVPGAAGATGVGRAMATGAALAATQPVYGDNFWSDKATQAAVGAILGPLAEYGVKGAGKLMDSLKGLSETGRSQALQDWLLKTTGKDKEVIVKALQEAQPLVKGSQPTALEALASVPEGAPLAAAQKAISKQPSVAAIAQTRKLENEAARQAEIASIAGTAEQRTAQEAARKELFPTLGKPALEANDAVREAYNNIEKTVMGKVPNLVQSAEELQAGQAANTRGIFTGSGAAPTEIAPSVSLPAAAAQKAAQLKTYQREALAETGIFPLDVQGLSAKLDAVMKATTSDESKKVLQGVKDDLLAKADNNGLIASNDLYENIRKTMNQNINRYLNQGQQAYQGGIPQQAAATGEKVKSIIDSALNKSSDGLWGKYLSEYASHSQKLNRMAVGEALQKKLGTSLGNKERAGAFAQAVEDSASLIKKATGQPRYSQVSEVLTPEETGAVNRVLADLTRLEKGKASAAASSAPEYAPKAPLEGTGNFLNRAYTAAKELMLVLSRGSKEEFEKGFIKLAMDPPAMAAFIQAGPISGQRKLIEAMNKKLSPEGQRILLQSFTAGEISRTAGQ